MLNPKDLKPGSVIRLTGEVFEDSKGHKHVTIKNGPTLILYSETLEHAELISTPRPTISREAATEIKEMMHECDFHIPVALFERIDSFVAPKE